MANKPSGGSLRNLLHFQARGSGDDGMGSIIPGIGPYETVFTTAARLTPARGSETIIAGRLAGRQPFYCTIRSSVLTRTIETSWQVVDARSGKIYAIRSPVSDADQKNSYLDMIIEEGPVT